MSAIFNVDHVAAKSVSASASDPAQIVNLSGGTLYYKNAADVDSGDSSLANGASVTVTAPNWVIGVSGAPVKVLVLRNEDRGDIGVQAGANIVGALNHDGSTVGLYGVTPAARPSAYTQTYATATRTHSNPTASAVATTAATSTSPFGYAEAQANAIVAAVNALIVDVANVKQVLNSVIDDDQTLGLKQ